MYNIRATNKFEKDAVKCAKRGLHLNHLEGTILLLEKNGVLPKFYKPHKLKGDYSGYWEAHVLNDWLLIWTIAEEEKVITLIRTGTHSDLFG